MISSPALHRPAGSRSQVFGWLLYLDSVNSWDSEGARGSLPDWQGEVFPPGGQAEALARSLLSSTHECDPLQGASEERRLSQSGRRSGEPLGRVAFRRGRGRDRQLPAAVRWRAGLPAGVKLPHLPLAVAWRDGSRPRVMLVLSCIDRALTRRLVV